MRDYQKLKSGKSEFGWYIEVDYVDDKIGVQSSKNDSFYVYVWDPIKKKEVRKLVTNNHLKEMEKQEEEQEEHQKLKSGKSEFGWYIEVDYVDDKIGVQSSKNDSFYVYVWDPIKKEEVRKLVTNNHLKDMEEEEQRSEEQRRVLKR